jgi:hypothetical protein
LFDRSSITRLSVDDKALRTKEVSSQERDLLLHKTIIPETIPEKKDSPVKAFIITTPTEGPESFVLSCIYSKCTQLPRRMEKP